MLPSTCRGKSVCTKKIFTGRFLIFCLLTLTTVVYGLILLIKPNILSSFKTATNINCGSSCCLASTKKYFCGSSNVTNGSSACPNSRLDNIDFKNNEINSQRDEERAFFLETSGSGTLNFRQACSVESLALHNTNLTVNVLFVGRKDNTSLILQTLKENYNNINFIRINLDNYIARTPLENWYLGNEWNTGPFKVSHLSDGLRFLTLYKYGGYYFDLDVISVNTVTYYRNFVVAEDDDYLGSSVMHADFKNPLMQLAIQDFVANYRSDDAGYNGPGLLLRVLKKLCNVLDVQSMDYISCRGINVLHYSSFYPVHCSETEELLIHRWPNETAKPTWLTQKVIGVHTWNRLTYNKPIYKKSTQYYSWLTRVNCPLIFGIADDVF
ncbi:lactosylceramide 4-alpha-galactosyltransferase-like [Daphnia pulex]|uniref:lactosylceramide 4-alpha-galactosyltransferase-like n=1 Tax=Daphnia pulex TaxID=6669 RepID=UPI001EDD9BD0|nr:lactosylceramide 4-alpha-galactosyltransferase-like [Daphnia pulex]